MSEQPAASRSGLFTTESAPVPLSGVSIDAEISSLCARVAVTQRYVNREPNPIEAVYVFPLDEGAAVCAFEAIVDGTLVVGEVKEREEAFRMYDDAMEQGHGAFLLDEERPDVFQASVGNLPPGKEVLLKLTYVTELSVEGSGLRFSVPTTVSPRYAPAEDRAGVGRPDSETLNPPVAWRVPYGLNLAIRLAMTGAIGRLESPSHPVAIAVNGHDATVTLSQRDPALDRDFVLSVDVAGLDAPQAWIERGDDGTESVAIAFVPGLPEAAVPTEVIFLVDRSGSMGGTSIGEVRNALQLCLRSMIPGCRFNIVGFGSTHQALFPASRGYDEASLTEASVHVAAMEADLGGTEILPALKLVLEQPRNGTLIRQVVVLTDGEVTNTDAVVALARQHAASARVFTFGIGAGASHHLVRSLARAGGGAAEFVYPGERIEPKVVRQFGRLLSPALTDVRVSWGGLDVTQAPSIVPPAFAGGRVLVYGVINDPIRPKPDARMAGAAGGTGVGSGFSRRVRVSLTAEGPSGPLAFEMEVDPARAAAGRTVAILAARARIRELEESPEWTAARGSRQRARRASRCTQEIVELGIRYGLMSRETSYVAVERRETPAQGNVQLRRVPIALTSGWGGLQDRVVQDLMPTGTFFKYRRMKVQEPSGSGVLSRAASRLADIRVPGKESFDRLARAPVPRSSPSSPASPARTSATAPAGMHALVALQRADGSWDLTPELAAVIGRDLADIEAALQGATGSVDDARRAWATALALAWLREHADAVEEEWSLLAGKARTWLEEAAAVPPGRWTWTDAGRRFFKTPSLRAET